MEGGRAAGVESCIGFSGFADAGSLGSLSTPLAVLRIVVEEFSYGLFELRAKIDTRPGRREPERADQNSFESSEEPGPAGGQSVGSFEVKTGFEKTARAIPLQVISITYPGPRTGKSTSWTPSRGWSKRVQPVLFWQGRHFSFSGITVAFKVIHAGESGLPSSAIQHAGRRWEESNGKLSQGSRRCFSTTTGARMIDREWEKLSAQCSCRS